MTLATALVEHFEAQTRACANLGSPFTASLCHVLPDLLDGNTETGRRVANWPGNPRADALALRLCGGLHHLVVTGTDLALASVYPPASVSEAELSAAVLAAIKRNDSHLAAFIANAPQTNEVARSGMLLPGFLTITRATGLPLAVYEIGASAGLNQLFDRFHYVYGDQVWGESASPVRLEPEVRGQPPLDGKLTILSRSACDVHPIDIATETARLRLQAYTWADQPKRLERLRGALQLAEQIEPTVIAEDAANFVERKLTNRPEGAAFVLFHSIMWQYLPIATRQAIEDMLSQAGRLATAEAPLAWLRMEPMALNDAYATLSLTLWPSGETQRLAMCDYHGRWIDWTGGG